MEIVKPEVELFWVMPVTFEPTPPLIVTLPDPLPELVIVPALLMVFEIVMPLAVELLLFSVKLPVPVMPPEWVKTAQPLFASVSPPAPSVVAPDIFTVPAPVPLVIVRALASCVMAPLSVRLRLEVAWSTVRLLFSPKVPLRVVLFVTPVIDRVPEEPERTVMLLVYVPAREEVSVALLLPPVFPSTIAPVPNAALVEPVNAPLRIVTPPVKVFAPDRVRVVFALSWITPVTLVPMGALIDTLPAPLPELVMVPVLLTPMVALEIVMPLAVDPSFLKIRLPVPMMPPVRVMVPF